MLTNKICKLIPTDFVCFETFSKKVRTKLGVEEVTYQYHVFCDGIKAMVKIESKTAGGSNVVIVRDNKDVVQLFMQLEDYCISIVEDLQTEKLFIPILEMHYDNLKGFLTRSDNEES